MLFGLLILRYAEAKSNVELSIEQFTKLISIPEDAWIQTIMKRIVKAGENRDKNINEFKSAMKIDANVTPNMILAKKIVIEQHEDLHSIIIKITRNVK